MWRSSGLRLRWHGRCDDSSADSFASLVQLWQFFPQFRDFRATLGSSDLLRNFYYFKLLFLGYTFGVAFFAPPVSSPLLSLSSGG